MQTIALHIQGKVQQVGFRYYTQRMAQSLGVCGWVRNRPDGSVEALVQGPSESLEKLIHWCHQGPPAANVEKVDAQIQENASLFDEFEIKY